MTMFYFSPSFSLSPPLYFSFSLSLTGEEAVPILFTGQRGRERKSRKCGRALSVPHSVSQSACVIIIL